MFSYLLLGCFLSCCVRNLNIHAMIITILHQQFNEVSVPIVIVTILLNSRDKLLPANAGGFPVVSASLLRSVFFCSLLQAFRLCSVVAWIQRVGEKREKEIWGNLGWFSCSRFLRSPHNLNAEDKLYFSALFRRSDRLYIHFCKSYVWVGAPEKGVSSLFSISKRTLTYI